MIGQKPVLPQVKLAQAKQTTQPLPINNMKNRLQPESESKRISGQLSNEALSVVRITKYMTIHNTEFEEVIRAFQLWQAKVERLPPDQFFSKKFCVDVLTTSARIGWITSFT